MRLLSRYILLLGIASSAPFAAIGQPVPPGEEGELASFLPPEDGAEVDRGVGSNALDGPVNALRHLVEAVAADGHPPVQAGEIVTTGTLTRALPIKPGERWSTLIEGIGLVGMDVQFE